MGSLIEFLKRETAVNALEKSVETILNLIQIFVEKSVD